MIFRVCAGIRNMKYRRWIKVFPTVVTSPFLVNAFKNKQEIEYLFIIIGILDALTENMISFFHQCHLIHGS